MEQKNKNPQFGDFLHFLIHKKLVVPVLDHGTHSVESLLPVGIILFNCCTIYKHNAKEISLKLSCSSPAASISENLIPGALRNHSIAGMVIS